MNNVYDKTLKYINILNKIKKNISTYECMLLIKNLYFTSNTFYYFLCILFRSIHLISFCLDYDNIMNNNKSFKQYIKKFTCFSLFQQINISYRNYIIIFLLIFIIFIIKIIIIEYNWYKFKEFKNTGIWNMANKFQIIIDHIIFLLFPFIIEFLSFIFYICFFPSKFIIKSENTYTPVKILALILSPIFIIFYNIENYINMICSNKAFITSIYESNSNLKEGKIKNNHPVKYKYSKVDIFIFILLQNLVIFLPLEKCINIKNKMIFKIIVSIFILLIVFIFFFCKKKEYNYINLINTFINLIFLFCFYSILFDFIIFLSQYKLSNKFNEIIYILIKIIISYIIYLLIEKLKNSFFKLKIAEILFQENYNIDENNFINSFYYLHEIMLKIKEQNTIETSFLLVKFLNNHIDKCNKRECNCKLYSIFIKYDDNEELKDYISKLLLILNYFFESSFFNYEFFKNYDLIILLAEHFCHLKNNPILAFSLINNYIIKQVNTLNNFQIISLYELSQKYIYYISSLEFKAIKIGIKNNSNKQLIIKKRKDELQNFFYILKKSYKIKKFINEYINNEIKILKYNNIFENSINFKYDENLDKIISVKINFFKEKRIIKEFYSNNDIKKIKNLENPKIKDNLYIIIYLLKQEFLYFQKIKDSISKMDIIKYIPIFMVFKYYLFFDFFLGGKMPIDFGKKLYIYLMNNVSVYDGKIRPNEYIILKKRYIEENNKINSYFYSMFEFKKEIRIKYFSENAALKLGYSQNNLINEKMDILMPNGFFKSHQKTLKNVIINNQATYLGKKSYFFDKSNTVIYPATFEITLIHNLSKTLFLILKSKFILDNAYSFLLSNNLELYANSINFEDEYYLNTNIFRLFNINIMEILGFNKEKLSKIFEKQFKKIKYQKFLRQIKTEEYFIPQLYSSIGERNYRVNNKSFFKDSKNNLLSQIIHLSKALAENNDDIKEENDEYKSFIKKDNFKKIIYDSIIMPREDIFHKIYKKIFNKREFLDNLSEELLKISENSVIFENDDKNYNLIASAKKLFSKLLTKDEFANNCIIIEIRFTFLYDKSFYFIKIRDEKKLYLDILKNFHFINDKVKETLIINTSNSSIKGIIASSSFNKNEIISRNKTIKNNQISSEKLLIENQKGINNEIKFNTNINNSIIFENNKNLVLEKIDNLRIKINKERFISIIKTILVINIICIIIIYIIIIIFQIFLTSVSEEILFAYYYNAHQRDGMLYIYSRLLLIYYDFSGLIQNLNITKEDYLDSLSDLSVLFKDNHYTFWDYFFLYNIEIGDYYHGGFLYKIRNYKKLDNYWRNINYTLEFASEVDVVIFKILSVEILDRDSPEMINDLKNFLFFKLDRKKVYLSYIKLLYYFCVNYEFYYHKYFLEFEEIIYGTYKDYIKKNLLFYILLEILGLIFYFIFYASINIYLHYSNEIIIKNIIFLFLDLSKDEKDYKNESNLHKISLKLIEFKKIIDDFDLNNLEKYSKYLDNINNKFNFTINIISSNKDINFNEKIKKEGKKDKENNFNLTKKKKKLNINAPISDIIASEFKYKNSSSLISFKANKTSFFNNKLENFSINTSKNILVNSINVKNDFLNRKTNNKKNNSFISKRNETEEYENIFDVLLNKSNKTFILIITIYFIIMIAFILSIIVFSIFKIKYTIDFNDKFKKFYNDFTSITNRYSNLYYYFNILRTLLIFPEDERKKTFEKIIIEMDENFEKINYDFYNFLADDAGTHKETVNFLKYIIISKNNLTEIIKEEICEEESSCINYLDSNFNIFDSGIDFAYRSCFNEIKNIFKDYQNLKNKTDIDEIKSILIDSKGSEFSKISLSLSEVFKNVQEKIYECFEIDITNMGESYNKLMTLLNIITIIFSFLIFLFVSLVMFYTIWKYSESIKDSTYRINCSFFYIKNYKLDIFHKSKI